MILIDKAKETQVLVFTFQVENTDGVTLNFISDSDRKEYSFELGLNWSEMPERYSQFHFDTTVFDNMKDGFYRYTIVQDEVLERGKALVKSPFQSDVIAHNSTDEILIYGQ